MRGQQQGGGAGDMRGGHRGAGQAGVAIAQIGCGQDIGAGCRQVRFQHAVEAGIGAATGTQVQHIAGVAEHALGAGNIPAQTAASQARRLDQGGEFAAASKAEMHARQKMIVGNDRFALGGGIDQDHASGAGRPDVETLGHTGVDAARADHDLAVEGAGGEWIAGPGRWEVDIAADIAIGIAEVPGMHDRAIG